MKKLFKFIAIIYFIFVNKNIPIHTTTRFDKKTGKLLNPQVPFPDYCTTEQHQGMRFWNGHKFCPHCGIEINHISMGKEINLGGLIKKLRANNFAV